MSRGLPLRAIVSILSFAPVSPFGVGNSERLFGCCSPLAEDALARIEGVRKKARAEVSILARSLGWTMRASDFTEMSAAADEVLAG
jgi:hypothetical protein